MTLQLNALDDATREILLERLAEESPEVALLLHAWRPGVDDVTRERIHAFAASVATATGRIVEAAVCDHPPGPPVCWCRPPLPGPWVAFAHRHGLVDHLREPPQP